MTRLIWLGALVIAGLVFGCSGDRLSADGCHVLPADDELYVYFDGEAIPDGFDRLAQRYEVISTSESAAYARIRVEPAHRDAARASLAGEPGIDAVLLPAPIAIPNCVGAP